MSWKRAGKYYAALAVGFALWTAGPKVAGPWDGLYDATGTVLGGDYVAFYAAGSMVLRGQSDQLYDFAAHRRLQEELVGEPPAPAVAPFLNPPPLALLMAPLAALPYGVSVLTWWALGLALLAWSSRAVWTELRMKAQSPGVGPPSTSTTGDQRTQWSWPRVFLFSMAFMPAQVALLIGQTTFVSLALASAAFVALRKGRDHQAGLALGAMILKPQLALGFGIFLVMTRRPRVLALATLTALMIAAVTEWTLPGVWYAFADSIPDTAAMLRSPQTGLERPISLMGSSLPMGLAATMDPLWPGASGIPKLALAVLTVGAMVWWWWRRAPTREAMLLRQGPSWNLAFAGTFAGSLIALPYLLAYDVALMLLPGWIAHSHLAWSTPRAFSTTEDSALLRWDAAAILAVSVWIWLFAIALWDLEKDLGWPAIVPPLAAVALTGWTLQLFRRAAIEP